MSRHSVQGRRWIKVCAAVKDRDGHTCQECGSTDDLTVDHIVPLDAFTPEDWAAERQFDLRNLRTLCRSCNGRKGNRIRRRIAYRNPRFFP